MPGSYRIYVFNPGQQEWKSGHGPQNSLVENIAMTNPFPNGLQVDGEGKSIDVFIFRRFLPSLALKWRWNTS